VSFISALGDVIPGDSRVLPSNVDGPAGSLMIIQALRSVGWLHTPPGPTWVMVGDDPSPDDPSPDGVASLLRSGPDVGSPADPRLASLDGPLWSTARRQVG
jgi:hypothetical protein